ncbi:hypothetical protein HPB48_011393 [Haemaphysalis longicornis]|uniref:Cytochrome P450 n=1 Tax=Haemaphysalis longicornis TaxID=44386 RepID=A0A9J6GDQ2_HAELO|nr:hypothetical protein HPB48_011393 [Haemaphysalis longicornis]
MPAADVESTVVAGMTAGLVGEAPFGAAASVAAGGSLDYDTVTKKLTYLGQVLDETLRIYSPALTSISRKALEDFEFDGIKYKAGTCFLIPQYHLQLDERFWPAPFEFDPDRFSRENAPSLYNGAHLPFGIGPRNCVGKQMATFEVKYTAARLVQNYRMELGPSQKGVMEMDAYSFLSAPANGPWIIFHKL